MYHFSISADSITAQCYGIKNLELSDGCFGMALCDMNGTQIEDIRNLLIGQLARVSLYRVDMPVTEYDRYVRFFRNAHLIQTENILLTKSAISSANDEDIRKIIRIGEAFSIRILFKPDAQFGLSHYDALRCENTGLFYDPCEFVKQHINPYRDVLYTGKYKGDIVFLRVGDMVFDTLEEVLPERGNAQIKECASALLCRSYGGYFSFAKYGNLELSNVIQAFCISLSRL